jgi:DNA helicase II / ATP-dependent DNA helicase PcrA
MIEEIVLQLRAELISGPTPSFVGLLQQLKRLDAVEYHKFLPEIMNEAKVYFSDSILQDCTFIFNLYNEWDQVEEFTDTELNQIFTSLSKVMDKLAVIKNRTRRLRQVLNQGERDLWVSRIVHRAAEDEEDTLQLARDLSLLEKDNQRMKKEIVHLNGEIEKNRNISKERLAARRKARHPGEMILNPSQLKAVQRNEGQVLITAGPGSGKTHVLTERAVRLIKEGCSPEKIIILTFTVKATQNLIKRMDKALVGYDGRPVIRNFHGFCKDLIDENYLEFGFASPPSHVEKYMLDHLMGRQVRSLPLESNEQLKKMLNNEHFRNLVKGINEFMHDRGVSPEETLKKCEGIEDDELRMEVIFAIEQCMYLRKELFSENGITFGDQITLVHQKIQNDPAFLRSIAEKYEHLMVDEFQDNNFAQGQLVCLLADHLQSTVVVGDGDQAIYYFRGANVHNMKDFKKAFEDKSDFHHINLETGYRHSANLVEIAEKYISLSPERLEKEAMNSGWISSEQTKIEATEFATDVDEAATIVDFIRRRNLMGIEFDEVAILAASLDHVKQITHLLAIEGVPFVTTNSSDLFNDDLSRDIGLILRICLDPIGQGHALSIFLDSNLFPISKEDAYLIRKRTWKPQKMFENLIGLNGEFKNRQSLVDLHSFIVAKRFQGGDFRKWLHELICDSGISSSILTSNNPFAATRLIEQLTQQLENAFNFLKDPEYLADFIEHFMEDGIELNVDEVESKGNVLVATIHKSKGLEWPLVILPSLVERKKPPPSYAGKILKEIKKLFNENQDEEEDREIRRKFFVGITRSIEHLFLSYPIHLTGKSKQRVPRSIFQDASIEVKSSGVLHPAIAGFGMKHSMVEKYKLRSSLEVNLRNLRDGNEIADLSAAIRGIISFHINNHILDGNIINPEMKRLLTTLETLVGGISLLESEINYPIQEEIQTEVPKLSWSKLNSFMSCPLKYHWAHELKLKGPPSKPLKVGNLVHEVIENLTRHPSKSLNNESLRKEFEQVLVKTVNQLPILSNEDIETMKTWLSNWMKREIKLQQSTKITHVEEKIDFEFGKVSFTGKIDRVETDSTGSVTLVDFKTSKKESKPGSSPSNAQLILYAHAWSQIHGTLPNYVAYDFVRINERVTIDINPTIVQRELSNLLGPRSNLISGDKKSNPGYHCSWCDFKSICPDKK